MTTATVEPVLLSRCEAGLLLGLSERTLYRGELDGSGPRPQRVGKRVLYSLDELRRWAAERVGAGAAVAP